MGVTFDAALPGTPEAAWRTFRAGLPPLDLGPLAALVVVAAHPDDETLMAGGLIATAASRGVPVDVVVASSGEASHPRSTTWTPQALAAAREREVAEALAVLAPDARLHLLRLPDGGLTDCEDAIAAAVERVAAPGAAIVSTWSADGHPDHAAAARAVTTASERVGGVHLQAPIWAWHHGDPTTAAWPAARLDLAPAAAAAKAAAMRVHVTQTEALGPKAGDEALLRPDVLAHFLVGAEVLLPTGPARPVDFGAMYAATDDPWGFADRWYERRKRAVLAAALPTERLGRVLEIGCSTGLGTRALAERADEVVAVDVADSAVRQARERLREAPHVRVEQRRLPDEWPDDWAPFDAIVLSETGFYLAGDLLARVAERCRAQLRPGGVLVLCHWRPWVLGLDRGGDAVHAVVRDRFGGTRTVRHEEEDFLLEVLQVDPATSVARATGLR
ncbi:PIG-L family deacetylase [Amnibacterium endophyticum]|uniref:PIG-L family deacetylase n=1 Tax=Amnibacterium endophyticum TaxID=2109337 RepID=A0ABW4LAP9_9MICO